MQHLRSVGACLHGLQNLQNTTQVTMRSFCAVEGLMYLAPACFFWLMAGVACLEWSTMRENHALQLMLNKPFWYFAAAAMGFCVNLLAYMVIQTASSLTLKVCLAKQWPCNHAWSSLWSSASKCASEPAFRGRTWDCDILRLPLSPSCSSNWNLVLSVLPCCWLWWNLKWTSIIGHFGLQAWRLKVNCFFFSMLALSSCVLLLQPLLVNPTNGYACLVKGSYISQSPEFVLASFKRCVLVLQKAL